MAKTKIFSRRINVGNPKRARQVHLACWGSQSEHRIHFILPLAELDIIIALNEVTFPKILDYILSLTKTRGVLIPFCIAFSQPKFLGFFFTNKSEVWGVK